MKKKVWWLNNNSEYVQGELLQFVFVTGNGMLALVDDGYKVVQVHSHLLYTKSPKH